MSSFGARVVFSLILLPPLNMYLIFLAKKGSDGDYTATFQLAGSYKTYLEGIAVARNLPASEMALGRKVAVIFFDEHNPKEAVVVAVYT